MVSNWNPELYKLPRRSFWIKAVSASRLSTRPAASRPTLPGSRPQAGGGNPHSRRGAARAVPARPSGLPRPDPRSQDRAPGAPLPFVARRNCGRPQRPRRSHPRPGRTAGLIPGGPAPLRGGDWARVPGRPSAHETGKVLQGEAHLEQGLRQLCSAPVGAASPQARAAHRTRPRPRPGGCESGSGRGITRPAPPSPTPAPQSRNPYTFWVSGAGAPPRPRRSQPPASPVPPSPCARCAQARAGARVPPRVKASSPGNCTFLSASGLRLSCSRQSGKSHQNCTLRFPVAH